MLQETGMVGEVVVLAVLEDEDAIFFQEIATQYEVGNLGQFGQGIRGVCEDEMKLLMA